MSLEPKRWQTEIWLGAEMEEPVKIYGESLKKLESAVADWLKKHQPSEFSNVPADYSLPERIRTYIYSDGARQIPIFSIDIANKTKTLEPGWYWIKGAAIYPQPRPLPDFESVIAEFIEYGMLTEPGPDYQEAEVDEKKERWGELMTHPAVPGALVGIIASACYLAIPIRGSYENNPVLAGESLMVALMFALIMAAAFALIGTTIFKGLSFLNKSKQKQRDLPSMKMNIEG